MQYPRTSEYIRQEGAATFGRFSCNLPTQHGCAYCGRWPQPPLCECS
uniref:Uncharacterized protein n=1 Tax=Anguilla anguilla TaxID=7936 RepID=A0A0E9Y0P5_ANGAN